MGTSMNADSGQSTGARDVEYNLISIAYHALQGADTMDQYVSDAERSGDQELAKFFRETQQQNRQLAQRARELLRRQVNQGGGQGGGR
jgi:rubrerythrin